MPAPHIADLAGSGALCVSKAEEQHVRHIAMAWGQLRDHVRLALLDRLTMDLSGYDTATMLEDVATDLGYAHADNAWDDAMGTVRAGIAGTGIWADVVAMRRAAERFGGQVWA